MLITRHVQQVERYFTEWWWTMNMLRVRDAIRNHVQYWSVYMLTYLTFAHRVHKQIPRLIEHHLIDWLIVSFNFSSYLLSVYLSCQIKWYQEFLGWWYRIRTEWSRVEFLGNTTLPSKIEKVPRGIRGEKSSKDMASSRNLVSTIGALASPKMGDGTRCPEG